MRWVYKRSSCCGFLYCGFCEAGLKCKSGTSTHTPYHTFKIEWDTKKPLKPKETSHRRHQVTAAAFPSRSTKGSLLKLNSLFSFFCFYKEWKYPCLSGKECKVLCGLMVWVADRVTVKLKGSLLESAIMQKQMKHTVVLSNTQTNAKVRGKKCTLY